MRNTRIASFIAAAALAISCGSAPKEIDVTWLPDNASPRKNPVSLFTNVSDELVQSLGIQDGIPSSMSAFLVREDGHNILFDAGMGSPDSQLLPALAGMGIKPEDVDYIFITHMHGDHIGGLLKDGERVFPNAKMYLGKIEHDAWLAMGPERSAQPKAVVDAYADQLVLFEFGDKLPFGIDALDARGHTPGHTAFQKGYLLIAGDIMHGTALQMQDYSINASFDMDQAQAAASRARIMEYAKENNLLVAGMHFPEPGFIDFR